MGLLTNSGTKVVCVWVEVSMLDWTSFLSIVVRMSNKVVLVYGFSLLVDLLENIDVGVVL